MTTKYPEVVSNWTAAIGSTVGAIGQTNQLIGNRYIGQILWSVGKGTQGVGSGLQATLEDNPRAEVGNWLISVGASSVSVVAAREIPDEFRKEILYRLKVKEVDVKTLDDIQNRQVALIGNGLQSIGAYLEALERDHSKRVIGGIIQSLGALIEAIGVLKQLTSDEKTALQLAVIGSWLQSIGTSLQAIGVTEQFHEST
ncbi:hypothetical protein QA612_21430 [Evansella sp. AB-P1]|uniref:DUF6944 family repetitive protein n=1 Tax=Evansella sp. AB-P1 TaxID=3037653 RepID=UPI00241DEB70|nr:hypothetical protein [Evansella sp. AB-P1]MDG5790022.1 hypothetical protein [Evansella sp. AB-P1]